MLIQVTKRGGQGIAIYCDHEDQKQVERLFEQISKEQNGQLDILVNNAYAAVAELMKIGAKKFFEQPIEIFDKINNTGLRNHYVCAVLAAKLMVPRSKGLIVTVSSVGGMAYLFNVAYGIGKAACDRLAADTAMELKSFKIASVSLWPGPVRTETIKELVIDANGPNKAVFEKGESVEFSGKCIVALATDSKIMEKTGKILVTAHLAKEYDLYDEGGSQPDAEGYNKMSKLIDQLNAVRQVGVLSNI
uniref:Uncharacterized protein n=1 Tax=Ditylenchus dipsaci TaxID=166011 RepID=A0A915ECK8_9BILA